MSVAPQLTTHMTSLVSILIPAFNAERWVADALESALAQRDARIEVIAVDDGSSDSTLAVMRRFESGRVKVIEQPNRGASAARNEALRHAQGDFIQWLDADDILSRDKVSKQLAAASGSRVLLSSAWGRFRACPARARFEATSLWAPLTPVEWNIRKFEDNAWMAVESWLVSRELTELAGPWDEALSMDDDGDYFSRVLAASTRVDFVPGARSFIRRRPSGSLSQRTYSDRALRSQFQSSSRQIERVLAMEASARTRAASLVYLQRWYPLFHSAHVALMESSQSLAERLGGRLVAPDHSVIAMLVDRLGMTTRLSRGRARLRAELELVLESVLCRLGPASHDRDL